MKPWKSKNLKWSILWVFISLLYILWDSQIIWSKETVLPTNLYLFWIVLWIIFAFFFAGQILKDLDTEKWVNARLVNIKKEVSVQTEFSEDGYLLSLTVDGEKIALADEESSGGRVHVLDFKNKTTFRHYVVVIETVFAFPFKKKYARAYKN